jgi:hypothetical protein
MDVGTYRSGLEKYMAALLPHACKISGERNIY